MKNIKQSKLASTSTKISCHTWNVSSKYFVQILLCILTIYNLAIIYSWTTTPLSKTQCLGSLLRQIYQVWKFVVYLTTYLKTHFSLSSLLYPTPTPEYLSFSNLPHLILPGWLKENELHHILPWYLSQKRGRKTSHCWEEMTIIGAGKRRHQQYTKQLLFWANLSTEVSQFLPGFLILCTGKQHFSVFVQQHLPDPLKSLDLNFTFSG